MQFLHFKVLQMLSKNLSSRGRISPKISSVNWEGLAMSLIFLFVCLFLHCEELWAVVPKVSFRMPEASLGCLPWPHRGLVLYCSADTGLSES